MRASLIVFEGSAIYRGRRTIPRQLVKEASVEFQVAAWRRKLLRLFPELHAEASGREFTPYDAFFELRQHLFEMPKTAWPKIVEWLSPFVVVNCRSLWKARIKDEEWTQIEELIRNCKSPRYTQLDDRTRSI